MEQSDKRRPDRFSHQESELRSNGLDRSRAILWEQGTGKSRLVIDTALELRGRGLIDGVLIVAPSGVHLNWLEQEIPTHIPDRRSMSLRALCFHTSKSSTKSQQREVDSLIEWNGFSWLMISYDGVMTSAGHKVVARFLGRHRGRVLYVLDESHSIKNPTADRTKSILRSAKYANYRRILTGTPVTQGPFDLYTQFLFLDEDFWGRTGFLGSYTEFKNYFGVWRKAWNPSAIDPGEKRRAEIEGREAVPGREYSMLVDYRNLDRLSELIRPMSSRVVKDDVLDLPPKLYQKRVFEMGKEQARLYRELRDEYIAWIRTVDPELLGVPPTGPTCRACEGRGEIVVDDMVYPCEACSHVHSDGDRAVVANLAMVRMIRLQQVACGYLPTEDDADPLYRIPGGNPRLESLFEIVESAQHKLIVWARFRPDIDAIMEKASSLGIPAVRYDGSVDAVGRSESIARFTGQRARYCDGQVVGRDDVPESEQAKLFVANQATGATGITLVQARTAVYYSNSFKLGDRLQSEDRCHRIGQKNQVLYVDLIAEGTIDRKIVGDLRDKRSVAIALLGDHEKEWI